jgi:hypothetical protein
LVDEVTFDLKSQPLPFIEKELLFVKFFSTVEQAPTLSAERKVTPGSRSVEKRM